MNAPLCHSASVWTRGIACCVVALFATVATRDLAAEPVDADLLLQGGAIYAGDGGPGVVGDVAVRGDRIVAVGEFEVGEVGQTIDCAGLVVAPGFIDLHNHSDQTIESEDPDGAASRAARILADKTRESACYLTQGCTTIVTGNCGGGVLDVDAYYGRLDATPPGVNVAHLVPQGAVRREVIGTKRRPPEGDEIEQMRRLVERGMQAGAWGMSTGLQYVPSAYAEAEEIAALAEVVAGYHGIYASHIRDEGDALVESVEEALQIGRLSGAAVHVSHFKASKRRNWGKVRAAAAVMQKAKDDGLTVTADQYPYAASSTSVAAMLLPDEEREGSRSDLTARLDDPEQLARLRPIMADLLEARGAIMVAECPQHPGYVGRMIRDIAKEEGREPVDVAIDVVRSGDEAGVSFSMDERDVRWVMSLPWVATASDGSVKVPDGTKPHPRSFGTFSRRIGRYAIEEQVVPLEAAIRSASGLPADILGMQDRGYLRPGFAADVVVFDAESFRDHATFESPTVRSTGVRWLLVNGRPAIADGEVEDVGAGRPLRKPVPQPVAKSTPIELPLTAAVGAARPAPPVPNQPADVTAVKHRLRELGFAWVPEGDKMDTLTIHTIKLFQSIVQNREKVGGEQVDGVVDPNGATHAWLRRSDAPQWRLMPARGEGFENYELVEQVQDDHDHGVHWLADTLIGAGAYYQANYRVSHPGAALIAVNDASRDVGRDTPDHLGHETGSMVDLRLPRTDGAAGGITVDSPEYDRAATRAMLTALHHQPLFERARLNDRTLAGETIAINGEERPLCVPDRQGRVHDNHIHVDIRPPR